MRNMSIFKHPQFGVPVVLPAGLLEEQVLNSHPFQVSAVNYTRVLQPGDLLPGSPGLQLSITRSSSEA